MLGSCSPSGSSTWGSWKKNRSLSIVYLWGLYTVSSLAQSLSSAFWQWGDDQLCASTPSFHYALISLWSPNRDSADYVLKPLTSFAKRYLSSFTTVCVSSLSQWWKYSVPRRTKLPSGYWSKVAFHNLQKQEYKWKCEGRQTTSSKVKTLHYPARELIKTFSLTTKLMGLGQKVQPCLSSRCQGATT